jgi:hypothetical protein
LNSGKKIRKENKKLINSYTKLIDIKNRVEEDEETP